MIVKRSLSPAKVLAYTRGPLLWSLAWAGGVTLLAVSMGPERVAVPFSVVGALGAALAIFVAFRNSAGVARWNEARAAWQSILVACRSMARQVVAATGNAAASEAVSGDRAVAVSHDLVSRLIAFPLALAEQVLPGPPVTPAGRYLPPGEWRHAAVSANPAQSLLVNQSLQVKAAIREGALGQFDPISLEPQLAALASAQGVVERIATTPTPRQYDVFTRWFVLLYAALVPYGIVSAVPESLGWVVPLSVLISGVFVVMSVVGAVNDEPMVGAVTDVPINAVCREVERDLLSLLGHDDLPAAVGAVDGYVW